MKNICKRLLLTIAIIIDLTNIFPSTLVWGKVQSAVNQLRGIVTDSVLKVVDEHKPKVIKALKDLQKVVIDGVKQVVIVVVQEVNGAVVKVLVDGLEGVSSWENHQFHQFCSGNVI